MAHVGKFGIVCLALIFTCAISSAEDDDHGADAVSYDKESFQSAISEKKHFVMFFAPWCGHCKRLGPTWNELAKIYNNDESPVTIAKVDCTVETALCSDHDVTGYPTLKFFHKKAEDFVRYKGNRDLDSLRKFVGEQSNQAEKDSEAPPVPEEEEKESLTELTDDTFKSFTERGFHFIKFYAPWCGHCKRLAPTWEELGKSFAGNKQVAISKVDCTVSNDLCKQMEVRGYPTLLWFKDGEKVEQYQGGRSHEDLKSFVNGKIQDASGSPHGKEEGKIPEGDDEEKVAELTDETFEEAIAEGLTFVKFFAPWCGHCKRLAPTWEDLGADYADKPVSIARVDCTQQKSVCDSNGVRGYPTLIMFQNGVKLEEYKGSRSLDDLKKFVDGFTKHIEL
ncbi:hypothetical protein BaRGS_00025634 [Batillaria attramentaria]|uniref:Thioredoxin domain-containing protein n=1 Tax=Batillaria attramentaria TaxID=370345 RepID=A0ABD0K7I5_9CAEN